MEVLYKELLERMQVLNSKEQTDETIGRIHELTLVTVRVQELLLNNLNTKQMKNGDYVIAPLGCAEYLTAGNRYEVFEIFKAYDTILFSIVSDIGQNLDCVNAKCSHLNNQDWILATESEEFLKEVENPKDLLKEVILLLDRAKELLNKI